MKTIEVMVLAGIIFILGALGTGNYFWQRYRCNVVAMRMKMQSSYGPIQGCMVEAKPGQWFPISAVRAI